jgi:hypothetical protein
MPLVETKNHIKDQVVLALGIEKGSLIDLETSGLLKDPEHEIICFGYIASNKLVILMRKTKEKEPFYNEIRKIIKDDKFLNKTINFLIGKVSNRSGGV